MADGLQRQMEGNWSLYPLLALVKAQAPLAGRKTLIFFSAGIQVPPNLQDVFRTVVSEANRSNVSVYSVDTRGLQSRSDIAASGAAVREAATASMMQQMKSASDPTTAQEMQMTDTALDSLTLNVQQTLSDLAEGTGGFLVANANDFGKRGRPPGRRHRRLLRDPVLPGRSSASTAASAGSTSRSPARTWSCSPGEATSPCRPTTRSSCRTRFPSSWRCRRRRLATTSRTRPPPCTSPPDPTAPRPSVVVEVPLAAVDFTVDKKKKTFEQRLTTLAVVKDAEGRVVERFSDEYPLSGPLDQLEAAKQSNAVLRRTVPLGAGRYTLETVSQVKGTGKTSVERSSFEVPAAGSGPQLSSLCLLRRADPLPADAPPSDDPFRYEGTRLVPHLAGPVSQAATPNLSFFARVYPTASIEMPKLTLDFVRDGKIVGRAQPPLPAPDASGRIAYVGGVPSSSFPPGAYEVRLTLTQGTAKVTQSTRFELAP